MTSGAEVTTFGCVGLLEVSGAFEQSRERHAWKLWRR